MQIVDDFDDQRRRKKRHEPPDDLQLGDVLQRLALIAPDDLKALEIVAREILRRRWTTHDWTH